MITSKKKKRPRSANTAAARTSKARRPPARKNRGHVSNRSTVKGIKIEVREEGGPLAWLLPMVESAYTPLTPRGTGAPAGAVSIPRSSFKRGTAVLAPAEPTFWRDLLLEYKRRKAAALAPAAIAAAPPMRPAAPRVPGALNWMPLGPSVVLNGQTADNQPVGGRVSGIAVAPGGAVVYAASANGGVFRSSNGGATWDPLMDRFDLDPTSFASASLICGAIALDRADPNRVYVGTGEGDTYHIFERRITGALPAYHGVGILRTDDGGNTWNAEPSTPDLAGEAFFGLAVDPNNREAVIGATTRGLYRRVPGAGGAFEWTSIHDGVFCSVAAAAPVGGTTRFFATEWGNEVVYSDDGGANWRAAGTGFPTTDVGRIALGVQAANPNLIYAVIAKETTGALHGLYRLDAIGDAWKEVPNVPEVLPVDQNGNSQGDYDLAIAIDPANAGLVYLGGSYANQEPWPGSIWRCVVEASGSGYQVTSSASIGTHAHADVHVLVHTPDDPNELWCGCDGGVFLNQDARGAGEFTSQNSGLACLCSNYIGQHPTDPGILYTGLQDNGTARTTTGPIWTNFLGGDGGYCLVNWAQPNLVLSFTDGEVYRVDFSGPNPTFKMIRQLSWRTMTQPIVGVPYDPASPADAQLVAIGDGSNVVISEDFGDSWPMKFSVPADAGYVFALAFASRSRLFAATTIGQVFRADRSGKKWTVARLDNVSAGPLGLQGLINEVAVDWSDQTLGSIYIAFAGRGDDRRVWRFDGSKWEIRSGQPGVTHLLPVEHNAIAVDRAAPNNVYVGADIGVWHSTDGGLNWSPFENGLPDAPVYDLQFHPTQRRLRAATHGRGIYEISLT